MGQIQPTLTQLATQLLGETVSKIWTDLETIRPLRNYEDWIQEPNIAAFSWPLRLGMLFGGEGVCFHPFFYVPENTFKTKYHRAFQRF